MGNKNKKQKDKINNQSKDFDNIVFANPNADKSNFGKPKYVAFDDLIVQTNTSVSIGSVPVHYISNLLTKTNENYVMLYPISGATMPPAWGFGKEDFLKFVENLNKIKDGIEGNTSSNV